ncbi:MAG: VPLPA-CTERM sorting domain-containing protein [Pseudomonadota bacterium]
MKLSSIFAATAVAAFLSTGAHATVFQFDGNQGDAIDAPTGGVDCNSQNSDGDRDICTADFVDGFDYSKNGVEFTAQGFAGDDAAELIQDLIGPNQGLGVISDGEDRIKDDQINFAADESIRFTFTEEVVLTNILVNNGTGDDCPIVGDEGGCGQILISVDGGMAMAFDAITGGLVADMANNAVALTGTVFEFFGNVTDGGYSIEEFSVVPVPGALPLLLSGIAGLGFASRRRKAA